MTDEPPYLYFYLAKVISVYDGDSFRADIDLGFHIWRLNEPIRVAGIDAPELRGDEREAGLISRDWLREQILGQEVTLKTYKDRTGKYGRYLAEVFLDDRNIGEEMIELGFAERYVG